MKQLTEKEWRHGSNAWGASTYTATQYFQIEPADVGQTRPNYLGHGRTENQPGPFKLADVGKTISVHTDRTNWTCWTWSTPKKGGN